MPPKKTGTKADKASKEQRAKRRKKSKKPKQTSDTAAHPPAAKDPMEDTVVGPPRPLEVDSDSSEYDDEPLRTDMPVKTSRWEEGEVDCLMDAINVNRAALKFHFSGPGGGKEIKRQAWKDVAGYVNDVAGTHRTVKQCSGKTADFTQKSKAKYNKLRREIGKTGRGRISGKLQLNERQWKALDYLREEAVSGIPDIEPMDLREGSRPAPSDENKKLLWKPGKVDYSHVDMKKKGCPKKYLDAKERKKARQEKAERKEKHAKKMRAERKQEKKKLQEKRKMERASDKVNKKMKLAREARAQSNSSVPPAAESDMKPVSVPETKEERKVRLAARKQRKAMRDQIRKERAARRAARAAQN